MRFLDITGVSRELSVMAPAVRTVPRRVRFATHVTGWYLGEVECSRTRFLDMAMREGVYEEEGWRMAEPVGGVRKLHGRSAGQHRSHIQPSFTPNICMYVACSTFFTFGIQT